MLETDAEAALEVNNRGLVKTGTITTSGEAGGAMDGTIMIRLGDCQTYRRPY